VTDPDDGNQAIIEEAISIQLGRYLTTTDSKIAIETPGVTDFAYLAFPTVVWIAAAIRLPLGDNPSYRPRITAALVDAKGRATMPAGTRTWLPRTGWEDDMETVQIHGLVAAEVQAPGEYAVVVRLDDQEAGRVPIQVTRRPYRADREAQSR
jgi:hypothetical protein